MIGHGEPRFYVTSHPTGNPQRPRIMIYIRDRLEKIMLTKRSSDTFGQPYGEIHAQMLCDVLNRYELSYCALRATGHDYEAAVQILLRQHQEDNPDATV